MIKSRKSDDENQLTSQLGNKLDLYLGKVPENEALDNLHLFIPRLILSRILAINFLYTKIINNSGIILEFGCRYGGNLALYNNLRGIYEPYNYTRKIVGFDTFTGFPKVNEIDDSKSGDYGLFENYEDLLKEILSIHNLNSPIGHVEKNFLLKGDINITLPLFLKDNTRNVAFVYFDMDLYQPTLISLQLIFPFLSKGSIMVFDDFNNENFKGESKAILDYFGNFNSLKFNSIPNYPRLSYVEVL
jgi:hypothetical protein